MGVRDLIVGFLRADVPLTEIDPYRRAGSDAYDLIDRVPPASWPRLAAWNAFLLQVYGDNLMAVGSSSRYVTTDIAMFARGLYELANFWLEEVRKAQATDSYRFVFHMPYKLPHWHDRERTDPQLEGMRRTLDTARTRTSDALNGFAGGREEQDVLKVRNAQLESEVGYLDSLWTRRPTEDLRLTIGHCLSEALDNVYELGQLLAQPELIRRLA